MEKLEEANKKQSCILKKCRYIAWKKAAEKAPRERYKLLSVHRKKTKERERHVSARPQKPCNWRGR